MIRDNVDVFVEKLNGVQGVAFVRDAWDQKAPDDYGVVVLSGQRSALWADNVMFCQSFTMDVWVYVATATDALIGSIQAIFESEGCTYRLDSRDYLDDIGKVGWHWTVTKYGPILENIPDGD